MLFPFLWRLSLARYFKLLTFSTVSILALLMTMRLNDIAHFASLGASLTTIGKFILYQIPTILPLAIIVSCLISSMLLSKKLSMSQELTALRATGLSLTNYCTPLLIISFAIAIFNFFITSELATRSHLATNQLKTELRSLNPLLLLHNKHLMQMKGGHFLVLGESKMGHFAKDAIIALKETTKDSMKVILASNLETKNDQFFMQDVNVISPLKSGIFEIENTHELQANILDFSSFVEKKTQNLHPDQLPMITLIDKFPLNRSVVEITRRLSLSLACVTLTLLGLSFGITIGRIKSFKPLLSVVGLAAFFLTSFFVGKGLEDRTESALILFIAPHILLVTATLLVLRRRALGYE